MSLLKIILISVGGVLVTGCLGGYFYFREKFKVSPSRLKIEETTFNIKFIWIQDSLGNELDPHAAMLVPVTLKGCPRQFYLQFDLGAPTSVFYKNKLDAINKKYNNVTFIQEKEKYSLQKYNFFIDQMPVFADKISVRQYGGTGINWSDSTGIQIIGTLGADIIENKILVIDYPHNRIILSSQLSDTLSNVTLTPFQWKSRRILLPAIINNTKTSLYFDTGSSAFELLTSKSIFERLKTADSPVEQFSVNSWGKKLYAFTAPSNHVAQFEHTAIPIRKVTYIEGTSFIQNTLMKISGMGGMTGNKLFIDKVLIIDTKKQVFGIYEDPPIDDKK